MAYPLFKASSTEDTAPAKEEMATRRWNISLTFIAADGTKTKYNTHLDQDQVPTYTQVKSRLRYVSGYDIAKYYCQIWTTRLSDRVGEEKFVRVDKYPKLMSAIEAAEVPFSETGLYLVIDNSVASNTEEHAVPSSPSQEQDTPATAARQDSPAPIDSKNKGYTIRKDDPIGVHNKTLLDGGTWAITITLPDGHCFVSADTHFSPLGAVSQATLELEMQHRIVLDDNLSVECSIAGCRSGEKVIYRASNIRRSKSEPLIKDPKGFSITEPLELHIRFFHDSSSQEPSEIRSWQPRGWVAPRTPPSFFDLGTARGGPKQPNLVDTGLSEDQPCTIEGPADDETKDDDVAKAQSGPVPEPPLVLKNPLRSCVKPVRERRSVSPSISYGLRNLRIDSSETLLPSVPSTQETGKTSITSAEYLNELLEYSQNTRASTRLLLILKDGEVALDSQLGIKLINLVKDLRENGELMSAHRNAKFRIERLRSKKRELRGEMNTLRQQVSDMRHQLENAQAARDVPENPIRENRGVQSAHMVSPISHSANVSATDTIAKVLEEARALVAQTVEFSEDTSRMGLLDSSVSEAIEAKNTVSLGTDPDRAGGESLISVSSCEDDSFNLVSEGDSQPAPPFGDAVQPPSTLPCSAALALSHESAKQPRSFQPFGDEAFNDRVANVRTGYNPFSRNGFHALVEPITLPYDQHSNDIPSRYPPPPMGLATPSVLGHSLNPTRAATSSIDQNCSQDCHSLRESIRAKALDHPFPCYCRECGAHPQSDWRKAAARAKSRNAGIQTPCTCRMCVRATEIRQEHTQQSTNRKKQGVQHPPYVQAGFPAGMYHPYTYGDARFPAGYGSGQPMI